MFFSEFIRLMEQVCTCLDSYLHLHGAQGGHQDTVQSQDMLAPVLHAAGRLSKVSSQNAVSHASYGGVPLANWSSEGGLLKVQPLSLEPQSTSGNRGASSSEESTESTEEDEMRM
jgi:hypothetical protein